MRRANWACLCIKSRVCLCISGFNLQLSKPVFLFYWIRGRGGRDHCTGCSSKHGYTHVAAERLLLLAVEILINFSRLHSFLILNNSTPTHLKLTISVIQSRYILLPTHLFELYISGSH